MQLVSTYKNCDESVTTMRLTNKQVYILVLQIIQYCDHTTNE